MAEAFNLNQFLQTYKTNTYDPTKQHANAEEKMETKILDYPHFSEKLYTIYIQLYTMC